MDPTTLRSFIAVAELLHFRRAAERLGVGQAVVSRHVQALEHEVGTPLLLRTTRSVSLTAAGATMLEEARAVLDRSDAALRATRQAAAGGLPILRLGGIDGALNLLLPPILKGLARHDPAQRVAITEIVTSGDGAAAVANHRLDAALVRPPAQAIDGLAWMGVWREPVVVALPEDHPAARRSDVDPDALCDTPMIAFPRHARPILHEAVRAILEAASDPPRIALELSEKLTVLTLVSDGVGCALLPAWVSRLPVARVVFRPLSAAAAPLTLALCWRNGDPSETVATLRRIVRDAVHGGAVPPDAVAIDPKN
ncbi:LysR family transcriptional regulator [Pontivivens ytuae]|uniref:LysR family transcriptional regulator n=1 Tax=Pontivivens ytuae TaxID=2789856 RepID=A0A7S9LRI7_9RHOB|nr:LysR family transcriptional regulator [Pontivivens ytuae]QPH53969.1 LysR family transcriptional regulator [Pontivivens ytuae]